VFTWESGSVYESLDHLITHPRFNLNNCNLVCAPLRRLV